MLKINARLMYNGWMIIPELDSIEQECLTDSPNSVSVGTLHDLYAYPFFRELYPKARPHTKYRVKQHHAHSLAEFENIVKAYQELAPHFGSSCYFRGQTRDYLNKAGSLNVKPAAYRHDEMINDYLDIQAEKIDSLLRPWARVLEKEFNQNTGTGIFYELEQSPEEQGIYSFFFDYSATARIASNPVIMAIVMHYGFETHCLDVSSKPLIALWFALHTGKRNSEGKIFFTPRDIENHASNSSQAPTLTELPSVYIFLQMAHEEIPVIDLTQVEELKGMAERPFIQSAVALPFTDFGAFPSGSIQRTPMSYRTPAPRFPSAVVKVHFGANELYSAEPSLTADRLFPKDEQLYQVLLKAKVPGLAIYV